MKEKRWLTGWLVLVVMSLVIIGAWVYKIDPYFHYHKPDTNNYYYSLNNQRSQNDGISKHFDYDALITGTSMTENFKTSEFDDVFGVNSIKVPYSGGSYKEINDNLVIALNNNPNLKTIVRCLDMEKFFEEASAMRYELGEYPMYLYDSNPFNDVNYLFNRDVIFGRAYPMTVANETDEFEPGITSFDDYSRWQNCIFGINTVCPDGIKYSGHGDAIHLTNEEKKVIEENITQNVTSLADKYPDVNFYYFFSPYSIVWWEWVASDGTIYKRLEAERYIIELILEHKNIHLYSFNNRVDIITDLNNYKDRAHYGPWVNSLMLRWMKDGKYLLTKDNYKDYLQKEYDFYTTYDYNAINDQEDYESDFYAVALLNNELTGAKKINLLNNLEFVELSNASVITNETDTTPELNCQGSLLTPSENEQSVSDYLLNTDYAGAKVRLGNIGSHNYLVFYGKKVSTHGQPSVYVYDENNNVVGSLTADYHDIDNEWHQYVIDLSSYTGKIMIIFNGGYIDETGSQDSEYVFKDIVLY